MIKKRNHRDYQDYLFEKLQDDNFASGYLNEAYKDEDQRVFLLALKDVLEARGIEITNIAKEANINRQNLHRVLSQKGNPRLSSLKPILSSIGIEMHFSISKR